MALLPAKQASSSKAQKPPATLHEDVGVTGRTTNEWKDKSSLNVSLSFNTLNNQSVIPIYTPNCNNVVLEK